MWVACARREFEVTQARVQAKLHGLFGQQLVDLHISDLINNQLPLHYDYTSQYDVLVFRWLAAGNSATDLASPGQPLSQEPKRSGPPILRRIDTSPVGFAVFDRVLLTVHPTDCSVRDAYASKLMQASSAESRAASARLPSSPIDLMLRITNEMVYGFLELRRELTTNWTTGDIMRTLTVLTAIFLPLNLIIGFFGMNFDTLALIHNQTGACMATVALTLIVVFWRKRYLARSGR